MRVVVTRPPDAAARWVQALVLQGIDAVSLPLIEIGPVADGAAIQAARRDIGQYAAVMFVSAAAVDHFFSGPPDIAAAWPRTGAPRAWAPGPGTASALQGLGVPRQQIDAPAPDSSQFDSEALWQQVGSTVRPGQRVLVVRGAQGKRDVPAQDDRPDRGQGREWLARQLAAQGAQVDYLVAYRRMPPQADRLRKAMADLGLMAPALWLFTSSQAIDNLAQAWPGHDWSASRALVTHPRIAAAARAAGFGVVQESRPAPADVIASIKSLP
jgi:uroporphyrinogen-III synthase